MLAANRPPVLFRRGGLPVRIERDDTGSPVLVRVDDDRLRHRAAEVAFWYEPRNDTRGNHKKVQKYPPREVIKNMLATPDQQLPILERIVGSPIFGPDGTLHREPGYNSATRCYYAPEQGFSLPRFRARVTQRTINRAKTLVLDHLLRDFPFCSPSDKAHALAAALVPFVREMIDGPTPLHLFDKPAPGTGATLLAIALARIATGWQPAVVSFDRSEEETRKKITSILRSGPPILLLDNVRYKLDSAALSSALTARQWEDRLLGHSQTIRVPVKCTWLATSNNAKLSKEIARRTIHIRLDAGVERPWLRPTADFRIPDLDRWCIENRPRLVNSMLTLVQGWVAEGMPKGTKTLGMFENWAAVMSGIFEVIGVPGFLENLQDTYEQLDEESAVLSPFIELWWLNKRDEKVSTAELYSLPFDLDLGAGSSRSQRTRLGKLLSDKANCRFGDYTVRKAGVYQGARLWKLENVSRERP